MRWMQLLYPGHLDQAVLKGVLRSDMPSVCSGYVLNLTMSNAS
jgi:hypothetical protein